MATQSASRFGFTIALVVDEKHTYNVSSPSYEVGAYLKESALLMEQVQTILDEDAAKPADQQQGDDAIPDEFTAKLADLEATFPEALRADPDRAILGDALDKMKADGMPYEVVRLALATVTLWCRTDRETAENYWNNGGRPRPTKRPQDRKKKSRSPRT